MSDSPKPGVIFSGGAFHSAHFFDAVKQRLEDANVFDPVLVSAHPSLGNNSRGKTLWDDVEALRAQMTPYVDAGTEFIVVGHSYGGFPGFAATEGWTVEQRAAAGKKGGIRAVVFNAGPAPLVRGSTAVGVFVEGQQHEYPSFFEHGPQGEKGHLIHPARISKHSFYNDFDDNKAEELWNTLVPHSQEAIETPTNYLVTDVDLPYYYILNEQDETVPPELQQTVASAIPGCTVFKIDAGHTSFLSQPARFVEILQSIKEDAFAANRK
ncbi:Alpha/beta hydrolase fold-1 [Annulohypoxylon maeteangense]|uniref:Alpha/beta hydrolase fold-1 n=1 Tax=Annulohypoxylon maeteangense TaxID=1927788 RepID=UPI002008D5AE|nr:Alpha/beta hydrolase fold-1 [Annulohypoxylon maeteangense]KAI0880214.1 Alpha/beta hydrolase fold-1 [Annulohypoxylon maeteangense]